MKLTKTRVLLTGASGRLGKELVALLQAEGAELSVPSSQEWDITKDLFPAIYPPIGRDIGGMLELVIHCAAHTDVPGAEKNRGSAVDVNIIGTCNVAKFARAHNAKLVYISSDYVTYRPMECMLLLSWQGRVLLDLPI